MGGLSPMPGVANDEARKAELAELSQKLRAIANSMKGLSKEDADYVEQMEALGSEVKGLIPRLQKIRI